MSGRLIIITCCLLIAIPMTGFAQGKGRGIELTLTSPKLVEVEPGRIVTASYLVSNRTTGDADLVERLDPALSARGWQSIISYERPIQLAAGTQSVQLVTFIVPRNCPAGKYEIGYSVLTHEPSEIVATETFSVVVKPVMKLDAVVEDKPNVVIAGDEYRVDMRLINNGNSAVTMKTTAKSSPEFPVVMDQADVTLEAGGSRALSILVKTDPAIRSKTNQVLEVDVLAGAPGYGSTSLARTVFVEILPPLLAVVDLRHSVPSHVSLIAVGQNEETGAQIEYAGSGTLDENGTKKIDFQFRGPDVVDRSVYGTREVLRLDYADPTVSLFLGDRLYSISPLSELLTYARGGGLSLHPGGLEIGSSYSETRWGMPKETETGAYAGYRFGRAFKLRFNYLNKLQEQSSSADGYRGDIYTVQTRINPGTLLDLGLEYARSYNASDGNSMAFAHRATLDGSVRNRLWYTFENTYAAPGFLGYYRDAIYSNGTVAFDVYRNLRTHFSYRRSDNNLDLDPRRSVAPRERSYLGGVTYTFPTGTNASLEYEALDRRDDLHPAQFDFSQGTVRLGLGHTFREIGVQSYAEGAYVRNRLLDGPARLFENYSIYTYYRPSPTQSYTLFTRFGHNSFTGNPERTMNVGASLWLRLRGRLSMSLSYQKNNIDSERLPLQDYLFSSVEITLPRKHSVSLMARWFKFENVAKDDYAFFAAYTIPLDVPAMKKRSFGSLKGTIIDRDQANATPVPNVIVSVGDIATMSNKRGEFSFPVLAPGTHQLIVDQRSMGMNKIMTDGLPIPVQIAGGETTMRTVGIADACGISGRVVLRALRPGTGAGSPLNGTQQELYVAGSESIKQGPVAEGDLVDAGGVEQVIVELSNGTEHLYQRTDDKGGFSFKGLRPDVWHIKIDTRNLPPLHYLQATDFEITLAHGDKRELIVPVLPRMRSIRLLPGGTITTDANERTRP